MKTTNFRTVEELNLDVNAPTVTPTKVQNDKIVRALKKLSIADPDETSIVKMVSAFVALGVNPQAKSSSWLARRLKNHLQEFGLVGAPSPVVATEPATEQPAAEQQASVAEPAAVETAKAKGKKAAAKKE
jgi:septal ring-binding cell division protein DamX